MISQVDSNELIPAAVHQYAQEEWLYLNIDSHIKAIKKQIKSLDELYKIIARLGIEDAKALLGIELTIRGESNRLIEYDDDDYRNLLSFEVKKYENPVQRFHQLVDIKIKTVLPDSYIKWFKNDLRASLYLAGLVETMLKNKRITEKGGDDFLVYFSDFIRSNPINYINSFGEFTTMEYSFNNNNATPIHENWVISYILSIKDYYLNNMVNKKRVRWIDSTNKDQVQYIYEYLLESDKILLKHSFFPDSSQEIYMLILASIDSLSNSKAEGSTIRKWNKEGTKYTDFTERESILIPLEKAWKYFSKRAEKSDSSLGSNIKIYERNKGKLEKLLQHDKSLNLNRLFNKLIVDEYNRKYIKNDRQK